MLYPLLSATRPASESDASCRCAAARHALLAAAAAASSLGSHNSSTCTSTAAASRCCWPASAACNDWMKSRATSLVTVGRQIETYHAVHGKSCKCHNPFTSHNPTVSARRFVSLVSDHATKAVFNSSHLQ